MLALRGGVFLFFYQPQPLMELLKANLNIIVPQAGRSMVGQYVLGLLFLLLLVQVQGNNKVSQISR